jgi:hypothetical protein
MVVYGLMAGLTFAEGPRIERRKPLTARVGIVAVGHHTYWKQFDGLLDDMHTKMAVFEKKVHACGVEVTSFGLLDDAESAYAALPKIKAADIDVLFVDMVTYATSSTFGVIAREVRVPIVLVALQPLKAMPYAQAKTYTQLCNDDFCSVPEFTGVAIRMGHPVADVILGVREGDPAADGELSKWCQIAKVLHDLRRARIGLMGHVLESMYDMHVDPTARTPQVVQYLGDLTPLRQFANRSRIPLADPQNHIRNRMPHTNRNAGKLRHRAEIIVAQLRIGLGLCIGHGLERLQRHQNDRHTYLPGNHTKRR